MRRRTYYRYNMMQAGDLRPPAPGETFDVIEVDDGVWWRVIDVFNHETELGLIKVTIRRPLRNDQVVTLARFDLVNVQREKYPS